MCDSGINVRGEQLQANVMQLRKSGYRLSNLYSVDVIGRASKVWESDDALAFAYADHGIERLCFVARNSDSLARLVRHLDGGTYYVDVTSKDSNDLAEVFGPTNMVARLQRLATRDCSNVFNGSPVLAFQDDSIVEPARETDAREINSVFWSVFRTEISHLLSDEEMQDAIRRGQLCVHRGSDGIDAVLQTDVQPKKFYINQIVNKTDRSVIHAMLLKQLGAYVAHGGKYAYSWVEENNIASQKFHAKYGMTHDGTWNLVYRLCR